LRRCLDGRDFAVVRGRRFDAEKGAPRLHELLRQARHSGAPVMVLWPRSGVSVGLKQAMREARESGRKRRQRPGGEAEEDDDDAADAAIEKSRRLAYLLIAIDGTWVQAQEMSGPLARWICRDAGGPAVLVHLDAEEEQGEEQQEGATATAAAAAAAAAAPTDRAAIPRVVGDPALRWRTEPLAAGMSTCEAVARALEVCERQGEEEEDEEEQEDDSDDDGSATLRLPARELRAALVAPLAKLVAMQVRFDPAMRARTGLGEADGSAPAAAAATATAPEAFVRPSRRFRTARRATAGLAAAAAAAEPTAAENED